MSELSDRLLRTCGEGGYLCDLCKWCAEQLDKDSNRTLLVHPLLQAIRGHLTDTDYVAAERDLARAVDMAKDLEDEIERLREAARYLIGVYMAGAPLADAVCRLEDAAGLRQQEGT